MTGKALVMLSGALLACVLLCGELSSAREVRVGVLGLFHPDAIKLSATRGEVLRVSAGEKTFFLESSPRSSGAEIRASGNGLMLIVDGQIIEAPEIRASDRSGGAATFVLGIQENVSRKYRGTLVVKAEDGVVVPIVTMDLETAVASAVEAESAPETPVEGLKAQAVVARSYFVAGGGRHHSFDFCDLTHCQFLREPPNADSPAAIATRETRGLVVTFEGKTVATMFTRSCGGRTRTPAELGLPSNGYPYYAVVCDVCYKDPTRWSRRVSREDAGRLADRGEAGRLALDRKLGWNAVRSNNFKAREESGEVFLEGVGQGHGIGLCQRGAKGMAEAGASFQEILGHYFPNTQITALTGLDRSR